MKQIKIIFITIITFLLLSACNKPNESASTGASAGADADDILANTLSAMEQLKSYSITMNSNQTITIPEEEPMNMQIAMTGNIITNPLQFYISQEIISPEYFTEEPMSSEMYFTNDGFYMLEPITNSWLKYTGDFAESLLEMQNTQINPEEQLNLLKKFAKNITAEEDESHYILNFQADGESLKEFIAEMSGLINEEMLSFESLEDVLDNMTISTFNYKIYIDKGTYYQTKMDIDMDISFTMEDETLSIKQTATSTISNFDNVGEITIPQEILDSAEEVSMDQDILNN